MRRRPRRRRALRRVVWLSLLAALLLPGGLALAGSGPVDWLVGLAAWVVKLAVLGAACIVAGPALRRAGQAVVGPLMGAAALLGWLGVLFLFAGQGADLMVAVMELARVLGLAALVLSFAIIAAHRAQATVYLAQLVAVAVAALCQAGLQRDATLVLVAMILAAQGALLWRDPPARADRAGFPGHGARRGAGVGGAGDGDRPDRRAGGATRHRAAGDCSRPWRCRGRMGCCRWSTASPSA